MARDRPLSPGRPLTGVAHDFTLQPGVPLIREVSATCHDGHTTVALSEGQFAVDPPRGKPASWRVPVSVAVLGGGAAQGLVDANGARITTAGCGPVVLNAGQAGYFRSVYTAEGLTALTSRLGELSAEDQLGLINDERALAYVGDQPMGGFLGLGPALTDKTDPIVWSQLAKYLGDLDQLYDDQPGQAKFRAYVIHTLEPELARIGWDASQTETGNVALMRASLLSTLGQVGDPAVVAEAHKRFAGFLANPASLGAGARHATLTIVAQHATLADWEQLHALAKAAPTEVERAGLYTLLGLAHDPDLAKRALDLAISGEPPPTVAPNIVHSVAARYPRLALDFAGEHWATLGDLIEPDSRGDYIPDLIGHGADPALIAGLNAFADKYIPASARGAVRRAESQIAYRARIRSSRLPDADGWLASRGS